MVASNPIVSRLISASEGYRHLRFTQAFEAVATGIALCHFDGRIMEGNTALARILGCKGTELAGLNPWEFHSEESEGRRQLGELLRGKRQAFGVEQLYQRKDASEFWGHVTVTMARDAQGCGTFLVVLLEDVSERKRLEEQLRQAEKMESVGRLTTGVAHDFNNLLTGFLLYCEVLLSELEPGHHLRKHVEEIRLASEHGAALTQQLLAFARKQSVQPRVLLLNETVSSMEGFLRRTIRRQIALVFTLDPEAGMVFADAAQIRQIVLNLALNAQDAIPTNGAIRVCTRATTLPGGAEGAYSLLVEDNGSGMSEETSRRIFEPFFTTKEQNQGTGMGLATVYRIAEEAHGKIEVNSKLGCGTRIEIFFPALSGPTAASPMPAQTDRNFPAASTRREGVLRQLTAEPTAGSDFTSDRTTQDHEARKHSGESLC
jgi:two-component system, cell cycle sensor histidine kinase and response regulator CckA